jgi:triosephosphate isomerase (TIM)
MRRKLVAGNWKMNGLRAANEPLLQAVISGTERSTAERVICPPFVYLADCWRALRGHPIALGGQNVSAEAPGAHTGEVAATMLKDLGCEYVIVGHSERRALYGESDALVARKFASVQAAGLMPILCVGESLAEREADTTQQVVLRQLDAVVSLCGVAALASAVVAYEPVWAIGTGRNATPDQAQAMHAFIRGRIAAADANIAAGLRVLYGGSVKAGNAQEIFAMPDVDGGLIGGASLKADEFVAIVAAAG